LNVPLPTPPEPCPRKILSSAVICDRIRSVMPSSLKSPAAISLPPLLNGMAFGVANWPLPAPALGMPSITVQNPLK